MRACTAYVLSGAFLIGAIALRVDDIGKAKTFVAGWILSGDVGERVPIRKDHPAKSRNMLFGLGEYVEITNPSPYVDKFSYRLDFSDVLRSDRGAWKMGGWSTHCCSTGPEKSFSGRRDGADRLKIESTIEASASKFAINVYQHFPSWSIAAILPSYSKSPIELTRILVDLPRRIESASEYEGSFVSNQCLFGQLRLAIGYKCEDDCEYSNDESGQRCDNRIVLINKMTSTAPNDGRAEELGRNFFLLLGAVLFGCFGLALLIRR